jgi:hypothetical protein
MNGDSWWLVKDFFQSKKIMGNFTNSHTFENNSQCTRIFKEMIVQFSIEPQIAVSARFASIAAVRSFIVASCIQNDMNYKLTPQNQPKKVYFEMQPHVLL